jgi:hypothetical protein
MSGNDGNGSSLVMIEKKLGLFLLNKLRTIHLFEADYNYLVD